MARTRRDIDPSHSVVFRDELPVPEANLISYEEIYVLEQWLRRLAYASLMARYGPAWRGALPAALTNHLKRRLRQLSGRVHLDCENSDNVIWLLTLEELREVLLAPGTWPTVKALSGLPRSVLDVKLSELQDIRNVVGHSRAVSANTTLLTTAIAVALQVGIDSLKTQLLYDPGKIYVGRRDDHELEWAHNRFREMMAGNDWSRFQCVLSEGEYFYSLTRMPVKPFGVHLSIKLFLEQLGPFAHEVLAVLVNRSGDEFTLTWPKSSGVAVHERIIQFFFTARNAWTPTPYELQSASAICDPRIWFYENRRPRVE
jgi:hypothetical protein